MRTGGRKISQSERPGSLDRFVRIVALIVIFTAGGCTTQARLASIMTRTMGSRAVAFRTMDEVYPYRVIARGGPVSQLPRAPRKLDVTYEFQGQPHTLDELLARTRTQGFLVIKGGAIVDERYFEGADDKSRFTSWSAAKSVTSTLVGLALDDGKIDNLGSPVTAYLPELKGSGYDGVPIRDILEMSSGVQFVEDPDSGLSDIWSMWWKTMDAESESIGDYAKSMRRGSEPGAKWVYRSVDTAVLGMLVNRVTGQPLATMLSERIWQPLGMEQDATWLTDRPDGLEAAYCCINATLRDYGRFGLMMLHNGKSGDRQLVSAKWVDKATNPQGPQVNYGQLWPGIYPDNPNGYGYQWWLPNGGVAHPYSAVGLCDQFIYVNPAHDLVIVKASAAGESFSVPGMNEHFAAFEAIGRFLDATP